MTTAARLDAIEPERADLSKTWAAIRRLVERTAFRDPASSQDAAVKQTLAGLTELVERAKTVADRLERL